MSAEIEEKLDRMIADMEIANQNMRETNAINQRVIDRAEVILSEMKKNPDHPKGR